MILFFCFIFFSSNYDKYISTFFQLSKGVEANALKHRIASNVMEMVTAKSAINENSLNNIKNLITQFKQCKV